MIGLAMRSCIDLGLHRKGHGHSLPPDEIQWRRRLFWTVYALERKIAISLGRPLSVCDGQIDVDFPMAQLPSASHYPAPQASHAPTAATPASMTSHNSSRSFNTQAVPENRDDIETAVFMYRLRRIESRIHHSIYRTDKSLLALRPKLDKFLQALEAWRDALVTNVTFSESNPLDYPMLQYHRAVRLLIHPFLTLLSPSDMYYSLCLQAAGNVCQMHKRLHQTPNYGHSFIAVQTVFVSGLTLIYGLWTHGHETWSITLADDIRACSLVLFSMSERSSWVRKYRDAFEILVNAAMDKLRNGSYRLSDMVAAQYQSSQTQNKSRQAQDGGRVPGDGAQYGQEQAYEQQRTPPTVADPMMYNLAVNTADELNGSFYDLPQSSMPWEPQLGLGDGEDESGDVWRVVMGLANWVDQDQGTTPVWMPSFEDL